MEGSQKVALLLVIIASIMFGFIGVCSRNLHAMGLSSTDLSLVRAFVVTVIMFFFILFTDRSKFRFQLKDIWIFILFGAFKFLSDFFLFGAQERTSLALATIFQMTAPCFVMVVSLFLFGEKITPRKMSCMLIAMVGLVFVCNILDSSGDVSVGGALFGIASGLFYALFMIGSRSVCNHGYDPKTATLYIFMFAMLLSLPTANIPNVAGAFANPDALMYILILGIFLTAIPFFIFYWAGAKISPTTVSVIDILEAVSAAFVGWIFFGEALSPLNIVGMAIILLAIVLMNVSIIAKVRDIHRKRHGMQKPVDEC